MVDRYFRLSIFDIKIVALLLTIALMPLLLNSTEAKSFGHYILLLQLLVVCFGVIKRGYWIYVMSPAILAILYISISTVIGAIAFKENLIVGRLSYHQYKNWEYVPYSLTFLMLCNFFAFIVDLFYRNRVQEFFNSFSLNVKVNFNYVIYTSLILLSLSIFTDYIIVGFSIIPKTLAALCLVYYLAANKIKYRFVIYLFIIAFLSLSAVESKREAIFLIFPIIFLESLYSRFIINAKNVFIALIGFSVILSLIIIMSIARGYGNFENSDSFLTAAPYFFQYINSPIFLSSLFNNIEATSVYYNALQSMEYVFSDPSLMSFGSTIGKVIFIFIPREVWEAKPSSIIDLYTNYHDPGYRAIGGSDPINIYAEFFWNFHFFGLVAVFIFFVLMYKLYFYSIKNIIEGKELNILWLLFVYMNFITYVRGSGLDMYVVFISFAIFYNYTAYYIYKLIARIK
ncbi:hypothetical protein C7Y70_20515 [Pseudoalteromonas sp. KS88]|uniref:O-antigen polymerase n=1 Tax=Pseudoalteromonas sp. KS88 TaxID=2109918 RepID=UPI001081F067|nr:O-antigen polymerase [Pseudoalteromonas sp. KS88]TGE75715.1 hypothetical protein C7Y70_20515 [Pseudoalteromonas sp. KS88]